MSPTDERPLPAASPPLDPAVSELAARLLASPDPRARALVPLSAPERGDLTDRLLGPERVAASPPRKKKSAFQRYWPLALAAALGLTAVVAPRAWRPSAPAIAYDLRAEGDMAVRGDAPPDPASPLRLRPSTRLHIVLTPRAPADGRPLPRDPAFRMLVVRDGRARLLHPTYQTDGQGAFTIDRPAQDALGDQPNGAAELVFITGTSLPEDAELERIAKDPAAPPPEGASVLRRAAVFEDWGGALLMSPGEVELAGCKAMLRGSVCELEPGKELFFWAPVGAAEARIEIDGRPATSEGSALAGGARWSVKLERGAREVALISPRLSSPFRLSVIEAPRAAAIEEAARRVERGELDDAEKALSTMTEDTPYTKLAATRLRARVLRRRGDVKGAETLLRDAAAQASAQGRLSDEIETRHVLAYLAITQRRDHGAAEEQLSAARPLEALCSPWQVDGAYYRGVLAQERGRYAEALAAFKDVRRRAERLGLDDMEAAVLQPMAELLSVFGRDEEALSLLRRALALSPDGPCERGQALTNWAWAELRAAGTAEEHLQAASRAEEALRVLGAASCGGVLATARMNAALAQAAAGRADAARGTLALLEKETSGDARLGPWRARLELELDLASAPARSLETAARLERDMGHDRLPEIAFEAAFGRARALDALNRPSEAAAAYRDAAARLTDWGAAAPLGEGRALFFDKQRRVFRAWLDLAVRSAEAAPPGSAAYRDAALAGARVVRLSLGQFLSTLLPRGRGADPDSDAAEAPPPGEARLYVHPIREGWAAIALNGRGEAAVARLAARAAGRPEPSALLAPFEAVLAGAPSITVLADRALGDIDFAELPFQGGVLSDKSAVAHGVGAPPLPPAAPERPSGCEGRPFALLVIEPTQNLAGAARAGRWVAARLGAGAAVLSGESATREAVLTALNDPCTRLFQYDGHAEFAGKDGVAAGLALADGPLTTADLLDPGVLRRAPETVILAGCETGREEGLGVAHAFLQRRSRLLLATSVPVDDDLSARMTQALYEQAPPSPDAAWDLAAARRAAVRSLRASGVAAAPLSAFRVLVR